MHTSLSGRTGNHPASPHVMVLTASSVISPAIGSFATVACSAFTANLTPASRRQDHTTSPSASALFVKSASASTAARSNVRDDGQRPSLGTGWRGYAVDLRKTRSGIFFRWGLDRANQLEPARQIRFCAQVLPLAAIRSLDFLPGTTPLKTVTGTAPHLWDGDQRAVPCRAICTQRGGPSVRRQTTECCSLSSHDCC